MSFLKKGNRYNQYKSMPGGNPHDRPVLMENGRIVDQDAAIIEDQIIADSMRYISKMTAGLATGSMSQDEEYIRLQRKVINELIATKSAETRETIETRSKQKIKQYAEAHKVHQKVLDEMYDKSAQLAKDNSVNFFMDKNGEIYQTNGEIPIASASDMGGEWKSITLREVKENMDAQLAKQAAAERDAKTFEDVVEDTKIAHSVDKIKSKAFDMDYYTGNSKVANSKYEKTLKNSEIHKKIEKKARRKKAVEKRAAQKDMSIYDRLGLSDYNDYDSIPAGKKAWITIHAKRDGDDPEKIKTQIKRKMSRIAKKKQQE